MGHGNDDAHDVVAFALVIFVDEQTISPGAPGSRPAEMTDLTTLSFGALTGVQENSIGATDQFLLPAACPKFCFLKRGRWQRPAPGRQPSPQRLQNSSETTRLLSEGHGFSRAATGQ